MRRRLTAVAVAALLAAPAVPSVAAAPTYTTTYITSGDGTKLHAEVWRPATTKRVPVVLLLSPYNNGLSITENVRHPGNLHYEPFEPLLRKGYAIVQASLRGYSASGGCGDWGGPGEQLDAKATVEWAASQPWSTGKVGMYGISYDGWTQVMALAMKPKGLAAVVAQAPLASGYQGLWMNGAHYHQGWWMTPTLGYATLDLKPTDTTHGPDGAANAAAGTATNPHCYATNATMTAVGDRSIPYWTERELVARASTSTVPVLYSQGFRDIQVKPDNFMSLYPKLRGPKRAWVGHFTHRAPDHLDLAAVRARYFAEAIEWFDAYLRRDPAALRRVAARPKAVVQQNDGRWRGDSAYPAKDARPVPFALRNGTYYEDPTEDGKHPKPANVLWSIGQRLPYAVHLTGAPRVSLSAVGAGPAQVVVKVYDVAPNGEARMVSRGVHADVQGKVAFDLYPTDWRFRPGHRIAFSVQGNEPFWSLPQALNGLRPARGENVAVSGAVLSAPTLTRDRRSFLFDKPLTIDPEQTLSAATIKAGATTFRLPPRLR